MAKIASGAEHELRDALLCYVEKRAFDPVLTAGDPPLRADAERQARALLMLRDQLCRLRGCGSARDVLLTFRALQDTPEGAWLRGELKALGLEAPADVSGDVENAALKLGVRV